MNREGMKMASVKMLIVDTNEKYLMPLEYKFLEELGDLVDLEVVTDVAYLTEYFSTPRKLDILIINEQLYSEIIDRHEISNVYILTEQPLRNNLTASLDNVYIYKYTSVQEIFAEVANGSVMRALLAGKDEEVTKLVVVYSPIGGAGKTTMAVGLAAALTNHYKKVLYISTDNLQAYGYLFSDKDYLDQDAQRVFSMPQEFMYQTIKPHIKTELFDYMPPFSMALSALNVGLNDLASLIQVVVNKNEYDYVIIDSTTEFFYGVSKIMSMADKVITLAIQDEYSVCKLERLLSNIDISNKNKFLFLCNKYCSEKKNYLAEEQYSNICHISEYIEYSDSIVTASIEELAAVESIQKMALLCL